ncbi:MAG: hypothetical protein HQ482_07900 [Sphingomonadales bacterium]|nr:hypothetical protein [Sphingomonadales bacterium]
MVAGSCLERPDGKGYPIGLDERSISMKSRIIAVYQQCFAALQAVFQQGLPK